MHAIGLTLAAVCATAFVGLLAWVIALAITAAPVPAWRPRLLPARLGRFLVRRLRRHRYARMAARIRALEIELGMAEPPRAIDSAAALSGVGPYWTGDATELADHAKNFFRNGAPRGVFIPADPNELAVLLRDERPCRECTAAPAHKQLHLKLQAATQLMAAGFHRRDAMEVAGLLDEPMMASDPSARDGFAWPKPDPRLTARTSE